MLLVVGRIARPHGVRGEINVDVRTDDPAARFAPGSVLTTDPGRRAAPDVPATLTIATVRPHRDKLLIVFEGIHDRDAADRLRGVLLCVDSRDVADSDDPDEFNDHQLIGLAAVGADGDPLGEVTGVEHAPASDLLVLRRPDGRSALVPFVRAIVADVDLAAGRVVVTPPDGLFDL
ncbi:MAG: rRNA processing protein RimM [Micromonosporaceae bacterium]|jgi:16S rRNA processing protein RimM|nr:rRNA processing protein RimM [Micromonosporaceae bacterium]MDT5035545.1 rRNA processing protein RimM [Micromonosporaceae bacterium]